MITFNNKKYELFFSNKLPPLIALNYADELFFQEFEKLCGARYRILSIIKHGWQQKYGLSEDIEKLKVIFESKIDNQSWTLGLLDTYTKESGTLRKFLNSISSKDYSDLDDSYIIKDIRGVRKQSAMLDAMSNMLHMFSSLVSDQFFETLHTYTDNRKKINQNFIFYTQPVKESRFAKITMKELSDKIELSEKDENFSKILRIGAFVKDDVRELLDTRIELLEQIFIEISKRIDCKPKDLKYLQIDEIEKFLLEKKSPVKLIKKRRMLTVLYYPNSALEVYEGKNAKNVSDKILQDIIADQTIKILRGQIASLGKTTGKVVIANTSHDALEKMEKNDILVAPYTTVEYFSAMRNASAIITETGGIITHAAIISRELNIPCIIGVENVTQILKDGQTVTVNADEGTIELI
jgi:phosphohistidine swiveling domain-containing protein